MVLRITEKDLARLRELFTGGALRIRSFGPAGFVHSEVRVHDHVKRVEHDDGLLAEVFVHPGDVVRAHVDRDLGDRARMAVVRPERLGSPAQVSFSLQSSQLCFRVGSARVCAYVRRWRLEMGWYDLKTTRGSDHLRCKSPSSIHRELLVRVAAHHPTPCSMAAAARQHAAPLVRIPVANTLDACRHRSSWATRGGSARSAPGAR